MSTSAFSAERVQAQIALEPGAQALLLSYRLPPACRELVFSNDGIRPEAAADLRRDWQVLDDCATVDGQGVQLRRPECREARIRVPAGFRFQDRVYPWAMPLGGGIYAHTQSYAVQASCAPVDWTFSTQRGTVVVNGQAGARTATRAADTAAIDFSPVLLFEQVQDGPVHIDPALPAGLVTDLVAGVRQIEQFYAAQLRESTMPAHSLLAIRAPVGIGWGGDAANRTTLRVMVQADTAPENVARVRKLVAHELAHFLQPRDAPDVWQAQRTMVDEGGAEFLALQVQTALGWLTPDAAAAEIQRAVNACSLSMQGRTWGETPNRGWGSIPYDCGLAFHALALAGRQTEQAPLALLDHYYHQGRQGTRTDFAQALECGSLSPCAPRWLPRLLGSQETVQAVFDDFGQQSGLLQIAAQPDPSVLEPLARFVFAGLMQKDCHEVSTWADPGRIRIGAVRQCNTLREGMQISQVDGLPLLSDPQALWHIGQHCAKQGKVALGLSNGAAVTLACDATVLPRVHFYTVRPAAWKARLLP